MDNKGYKIGELEASIGGDSRYTDTMRVYYDPESNISTITVTDSSAVGGMDGPGGSFVNNEKEVYSLLGTTPNLLLKAIRSVIADNRWNFKKYGKPTKNFEWRLLDERTDVYGLNVQLVQKALAQFDE